MTAALVPSHALVDGRWTITMVEPTPYDPSTCTTPGCTEPVPWAGAKCDPHRDAFYAWLNTPITDAIEQIRGGKREQAPADPEKAKARVRAIAYLQAYKGDWDLVLDLRAKREWGTAHFRLSDRQIEVLNAAADRDEARAKQAAEWAAKPEALEVIEWAVANAGTDEFAASMVAAINRYGSLTDRQMAVSLQKARAATGERTIEPGAVKVRAAGASQDGWYKVGDEIYKVQVAVHGSGRLYAKRLLVIEHGKAEWVYAPGMVSRLTDEQRLTPEAAAEFGRLYGVCGICGRTLTDEGSIEAGIGPVCARKLA